MSGPLVIPAGTQTATSLNFGTAGTGLLGSGTQVSIAVSGVTPLTLGGTSLVTTVPVRPAAGTQAAPAFSFSSETSSGLFRKSAGVVSMSAQNVEVMNWATTSKVTTAYGAVVLPADPVNPLESATKQYVDAGDAIAVKYNAAQGLTDPQTVQGRQNVYAAPFDALAYNGMQINGSMEISQERGNTAYSLSNGAASYIQDGWLGYFNTAGALTINAGPQVAITLPGFASGVQLAAGTGAAMGANDAVSLLHRMEGYRIARLAFGTPSAQSITICFWVRTTIPGTMSVVVSNAGAARSYAATVAINAANTWEYKTITIPGDITGTWTAVTNAIGMLIRFCFGVGATVAQAAGSWLTSANGLGAVGTTNFMASNSNQANITGVVVLPGNEAPSSARSALIMRPYDQELVTCKRYWEQNNAYFATTSGGVATGGAALFAPFSVQKRAAPTSTVASSTLTACTFSSISGTVYGARVVYNITAAAGAIYVIDIVMNSDARL